MQKLSSTAITSCGKLQYNCKIGQNLVQAICKHHGDQPCNEIISRQ